MPETRRRRSRVPHEERLSMKVSARINEKTYRKIEEGARSSGSSISSYVRRSIEESLEGGAE